ncbi:MAG: hypothetical protein R2939_09840 [Kofleriaceae bacterium]
MKPTPFPHRVSFLAPTLAMPPGVVPELLPARLLAATLFEHLLAHPVVAMLDLDEDRVVDASGALLDARHPDAEEVIDWHFRTGRRREVLWLDLSLDPGRPTPTRLLARSTHGPIEQWTAAGGDLGAQLETVVSQWLAARYLAPVPPMAAFSAEELLHTSAALERAVTLASDALGGGAVATVPDAVLRRPPAMATAYYRVLAELAPAVASLAMARILALRPDHPVARRAAYLASLRDPAADRRAILAVTEQAPTYGKAHLSIWGDAFAGDRPEEGMGLRHQGLAALLSPTNPYACHNYALQLAERGRREESYRWADRASVLSPTFASAHLDCARRVRRMGRAGQAFAEIQYRCGEVLGQAARGELAPQDRAQVHHAELLLAFGHLDVGQLDRAIAAADAALTTIPEALRPEFAWAERRLDAWRRDPATLAKAFAVASYHAGDPGQVVRGLGLGKVTDEDDLAMLLDALIALGRPDQAAAAFHHLGAGDKLEILGDGKARLAAAKALILVGELDLAIEQLLVVQLRRPQSRLEAEVCRVLRLAATRPASQWDEVLRRWLQRGAPRLARLAARDIADFVPGLARTVLQTALGGAAFALPADAFDRFAAAIPEAEPWAAAIRARLALPAEDSMVAADRLVADWWSVLVPPAKHREGHAASALFALGLALGHYLPMTTQPPTPLTGAYRHVAAEALHLVRRARFQIEDHAIRALLELLERCAGVDPWVLDTWLLRVERALDLEAEHGSLLGELTRDLPTVGALLRGDERIGWELRFAFDLASDPSQAEPAAMMFERALRATEAGAGARAWARLLPAEAGALDAAWLTALAAQDPEAWRVLASAAFASGRISDGLRAADRAMRSADPADRPALLAALAPSWHAAGVTVPFDGAAAHAAGATAIERADVDGAIACLRWAATTGPRPAEATQHLVAVLAKAGRAHEALREFATIERADAPRKIGRVMLECGRPAEALTLLRYASARFTRPEEWELLAVAAWHAGDKEIAASAYQQVLALGGAATPELLAGYVSALNAVGRWVEAAPLAKQLVDEAATTAPAFRGVAAREMATALLGQGRFADAARHAREAQALLPNEASALTELVRRCDARQAPAVAPEPADALERRAYAALERGDLATVHQLTEGSTAAGVRLIALVAAERRADDDPAAVPVRELEAATGTLERTAGATAPASVLARLRALRLRENAFILIDPPPPAAPRLPAARFDAEYAQRRAAMPRRSSRTRVTLEPPT